jgi:hypothetical protein
MDAAGGGKGYPILTRKEIVVMIPRYTLPFLVLMVAIQNCQSGRNGGLSDETADPIAEAFDRYADLEPVRHEANPDLEQWVDYFYSTSDCKCVLGGEYFISVKDQYPGSRNLMISLQGGGGCWPGMEECKEEVTRDDIYTTWYTTELANALEEEWNEILIPYCDGSVYLGDSEVDYNGDGSVDHWHWGLRASTAGILLAKKNFPELDKIFITGCSAGGYGTFTVTRLVRHQYPGAKIYVLNESGPGLFNPDEPNTWKTIGQAWNSDLLIPAGCTSCEDQLIYWYDTMLENDSNLRIGLYSSYEDEVVGEEYLAMTGEDFRELLLTSSGYLNEKYPDQFKRFFIAGDSHCVEEHEYQIEGIRYWDWVLAFLTDNDLWMDLLE